MRSIKQRISKWKSLCTKILTCKPLNDNPQAKVCKRVFFITTLDKLKTKNLPSLKKNKTYNIDKQIHIDNEKEALGGNRRLAQWRFQWLIEHSASHQLLWGIDSFVLRNPPLRQAPKRYRLF